MFKELTGADFNVPLYRGGGPAMADLFANQVQAIFQPLDDRPADWPMTNASASWALRPNSGSSLLPDVPTLAEQGFPQVIANSWNGLAAPAGTPAAMLSRLNQGGRRRAQFGRA